MPDAATLAQMYGPEYLATWYPPQQDSQAPSPAVEMPAAPSQNDRVAAWLKKARHGTFLDYGCGAGHLLREAMRLHWQAVGVELDAEVAASVAQRTGARVVSEPALLGQEPLADVLHLGDVLEHLTDLDHQVPAMLGLLKPNGLLLAQGPLENNFNVFTLTLRLARSWRGAECAERAPYHVLLATARGQRELFRRCGLREVEFSVSEVAWPAPRRLSRPELRRPRSVGLFVLRRLSQAISRLVSRRWGNRYFYAGRWAG